MLTLTGFKDIGVLGSTREGMVSDIIEADWKIKKHVSENYLLLEQINGCTWFSDKTDFIENFFKKIYGIEFNSILCGGLGLGIVPYLVQSFCEKIDVIEISQGNIDLIKNNTDYLGSSVNIVQGDIRTYSTLETYDVILLDIWTCNLNAFESEKEALKIKYAPNLNPGGLLYLPFDEYYKPRQKR